MKKLFTICVSLLLLLGTSKQIEAHSPHEFIEAMAISPAYSQDQTLFCSITHINFHILKSTDKGLSWAPSEVGFPHYRIKTIAFSPSYLEDDTIFVGTADGGIFKSTDGGFSWESCNEGLNNLLIKTIAISPHFATDQTILVGTIGGGIFKSVNAGASWNPCNTGLTNLYLRTLAFSPSYHADMTIFAGTHSGVFKSINGGVSWFRAGDNLSGSIITAFSVSPTYSDDQAVFAGTWGEGIFKSLDGGNSWVSKNEGITELNIMALAISPDYDNDLTLFVATQQVGIFKSSNGGDLWSLINNGLAEQSQQNSNHYFAFGISPNYKNDLTIYLAGFEGVHKSNNGGERWHHLNVYQQQFVRSVITSPDYANDGMVFAGTYGGGVYKSADKGNSWEASTTGMDRLAISSVVVSPSYSTDGTVFAAAFKNTQKTTNMGNSWTALRVDPDAWVYIRSMAISPEYPDDQILFAGNGGHGDYPVYKTVDGGASFIPFSADFSMCSALTISSGYNIDQTVFAGTEKGVFRTQNGGTSWEFVGLPGKLVLVLAISPSFPTDGVVFAGVFNEGVFKSTDWGNSWTPVNNGLEDLVVESIGISPNYLTDETIFAATKGGGIFKSTDAGGNWHYLDLRGEFLRSIAVSPAFGDDETLFVGTWNGVYKSVNGGNSWELSLDIIRYDDSCLVLSDKFRGSWKTFESSVASGLGVAYSSEQGAKVVMYFLGNSISWIGGAGNQCGIADIYLDDVFQAEVDLYSPSREWQKVLYTKNELGPGLHCLTVEVSGQKNPAALGRAVIIDAFEVGIR